MGSACVRSGALRAPIRPMRSPMCSDSDLGDPTCMVGKRGERPWKHRGISSRAESSINAAWLGSHSV
eukprot:2153945-Alexandrium_andersonii.AAC.1